MAGTIVSGTIVDKARRQLFEIEVGSDTGADIQWDRTRELLAFLNDAQREIAIAKPDAYVRNEAISLAAGAKQTLPAGGRMLNGSGIQHNMGADGLTPGRPITLVDRLYLARIRPSWMTDTGNYVEHYLYDQTDPRTYFVYPRPSGAWYVNASFPADPPGITEANIDSSALGLIQIGDEYAPLLHDYIVGYALLKTFKAESVQRAGFFLNKFYNALGRNFQMKQATQPIDQRAQETAPNAAGKA